MKHSQLTNYICPLEVTEGYTENRAEQVRPWPGRASLESSGKGKLGEIGNGKKNPLEELGGPGFFIPFFGGGSWGKFGGGVFSDWCEDLKMLGWWGRVFFGGKVSRILGTWRKPFSARGRQTKKGGSLAGS